MQRTFNNLEHWTQKLFEKLGWMILATHDNNIASVTQYLLCINNLIKKIDEKISVTGNRDTLDDLLILKQQAEYLQVFANNTLTNATNFKN